MISGNHDDDFRSTLNSFKSEQIFLKQKSTLKTGITALDDVLGGGFAPGLISLGAVSSLGKSTFALQIAYNIAKGNNYVLLFSLEMKRDAIMAKLLSQQWHANRLEKWSDEKIPGITAQDLMNPEQSKSALWNEVTEKKLDELINDMASNNNNLSIIETSSKAPTVKDIIKTIDEYSKKKDENGNPVNLFVVIDYLQILAPDSEGYHTDKQIVDRNLAELKQCSDRYSIPILLISAFNRDSYDKRASLQSFKDSGNIEYSSDVLLALQYKGVGEKDFNIDEAKTRSPRQIELVVLKQRYGASGQTIPLSFQPEYSYFTMESNEPEEDEYEHWLVNGRLPKPHAGRYF